MQESKNKIHINIATRVGIAFALVFIAIGLIAYQSYLNLKEEKENLIRIKNVSESSANVLDISREISDIQRLVKVYGQSGSNAVLDKINENFSSLQIKLKEVKSSISSDKRLAQVESLETLLKSYGENINSLKKLYQIKDNFINNEFPHFYESGLNKLNAMKGRKKGFELLILNQIILDWNNINYNAIKYFSRRDAVFNENIKTYLRHMNILNEKNVKSKEISELIKGFKKVFKQTQQANRVYLSLVNVVMAGTAIEFTNLTQNLRVGSIKDLNNIKKISDQKFIKNKRDLTLYTLISILFIVLIAWYIHNSITKKIEQIASTFNSFVEGDLSKEIPAINQRDEIGSLAKAASAFRDVSIKIKEEQARAEELSKSKSKFLATMSHEIRTPMNAVLSSTALLIDEIKDPEKLELLNTIKNSGDSLLIIINDILDFSKIESGNLSIENRAFDVKKAINDIINLLNINASEKGVVLNSHINENTPDYIMGDVTRFKQVLINLLGNAIKFANSNVNFYFDIKLLENDFCEVYINVEDDGIGIAKEDQKILFDEFSQVDASTTRKYGGTGLGLAICKGLSNAMGGKIAVKSELNKGSVFTFSLKCRVAQSVDKEADVLAFSQNKELNPNLKILLAEDNPVNQMVARRMLQKIGYDVTLANNGEEAVAMAKLNNYDLIFMDQHMPIMDGVEATKNIRKLSIKQPLIYALTASAFDEDKLRCLNAGMDGFLTKPIIIEEIIDSIKKCS